MRVSYSLVEAKCLVAPGKIGPETMDEVFTTEEVEGTLVAT